MACRGEGRHERRTASPAQRGGGRRSGLSGARCLDAAECFREIHDAVADRPGVDPYHGSRGAFAEAADRRDVDACTDFDDDEAPDAFKPRGQCFALGRADGERRVGIPEAFVAAEIGQALSDAHAGAGGDETRVGVRDG